MSPRVGSPTPGASGASPTGVARRGFSPPGRSSADDSCVEQAAPLLRVVAREEHVERHVGEVRIAVPRLAIGERELRALGDRVDVLRRVLAHPREVEALEQPQLLEEDRRLAPRPGLEHLVAVVVDRERLLPPRLPRCQVFRREKARVTLAGAVAPLALLERDELLGDPAAVPVLHRILRRGEPTVRLGELRVRRHRPRLGDGKVEVRRRRPVLAEELLDVADRAGDLRQDGIAGLGVVDRVVRDLLERHRPVLAEQREPAAERAGDDGRKRAGAGDQGEAEVVAVALDRRCGGGRALRAEHERAVAVRGPDERGQVAAGPVEVRLDDLQRQPGRNRGVERVAAELEHGHPRRRREPVRRRDHAERAAKLWASHHRRRR